MGAVLRKTPQSIVLHTSSRTDAGVHAFMNTTCVDIPEKNLLDNEKVTADQPATAYDPEYLQSALNITLTDLNLDVRSYLYRLAVLKSEYDRDPIHLNHPSTLIPLIEQNRCWPIRSDFNLDLFKAAAKEFIGEKNVASFMGSPRSNIKSQKKRQLRNPDSLIAEPQLLTMRYIKHIGVEAGQPLMDPKYEPFSDCFNFFDITVVAKSFVYKQIRKMMAIMVGVAQEKLKVEDVRWMLDNPHHVNFSKYPVEAAPPGGLYLKEIAYNPKDFTQPTPIVFDDRVEEVVAELSQNLQSA